MLPGWCSTPTLLLVCSSFSRENCHSLLICSSLSTCQLHMCFFFWSTVWITSKPRLVNPNGLQHRLRYLPRLHSSKHLASRGEVSGRFGSRFLVQEIILSSWWLNHPFEKYESKWIISPVRLKKKIFETTTQLL